MPEMRGPQLLTEIRRLSPSTAAVLMSGYAEPGEMPAGIPFLSKPFSSRELVATVERVLAESIAARQNLQQANAKARGLLDDSRRICEEAREAVERSKNLVDEVRRQCNRNREPSE
jgi:DNA-binding NtrC family response regulator